MINLTFCRFGNPAFSVQGAASGQLTSSERG